MHRPDTDKVFAESMPVVYDTYLVPLIFEPYARYVVGVLAERPLGSVLEIAAGSGAVTRAMAAALPEPVAVVATDLSMPMLEHAIARGTARPVEWRQADAMALPFEDDSFDAVVCQFGAMFFPDKARAFAEARRVLRPGGLFLCTVWDRIEENEFADVITTALAGLIPSNPPRFLARTPHGYDDPAIVRQDLVAGGFASPRVTTVAARSRASSAEVPAIGYVQGTPLRTEIGAAGLDEATAVAKDAIARRFGAGPVDGKIQAHIATAEA